MMIKIFSNIIMLSLDNLINYLEPKQDKNESGNKETSEEISDKKVINKSFKEIPEYLE